MGKLKNFGKSYLKATTFGLVDIDKKSKKPASEKSDTPAQKDIEEISDNESKEEAPMGIFDKVKKVADDIGKKVENINDSLREQSGVQLDEPVLPLFTNKESIKAFLNTNKTSLENGIKFVGVGRQLVIYDDKVCIENSDSPMGGVSLLMGEGTAEAYFQDITAFVHVPTQAINVGKLIVKVKGHVELKRNDPFTIDIPKKNNEQFSQAKILLDYLLKKSKTSSSQPATIIQEKQPDIVKQIKELSELKDLGILSDEEFESKKTELLSKM